MIACLAPETPEAPVPLAASAGRRLGALLREASGEVRAPLALARSPDADDAVVTGVVSDSRRLVPGDLFVAIPGDRFDGHDFLGSARDAGAAAALVARGAVPPGLPWVRVEDPRRAAGPVAAALYAHPARDLRLVGVTGTNGKTTVAWLVDAICSRALGTSLFAGTVAHRWSAGRPDGAPGTPDSTSSPGQFSRPVLPASSPGQFSWWGRGGAGRGPARATVPTRADPPGQRLEPASLTTREGPDFQAFLARARDGGCRAGAVECSSHGLALGRLEGSSFEVAVFTNLTRDHFDFHRDFEDYFAAKRTLFTRLLRTGGAAVVGTDDAWGARLARELEELRPDVTLLRFGVHPDGAGVRIVSARPRLDGLALTLETESGTRELESRLTGDFHASNLAAAWAAGTALGVPDDELASGLAAVPPPPGRMERIEVPGRPVDAAPAVFVDYAHTPDALARALATARRLVGSGRLSVVFGAGGDRDRDKRPLMGDAAARLADRVVLTSDNPRSEDPDSIVAAIRLGTDNAALSAEVSEESDRAAAIASAISDASAGDLVLIAGKGHETTQEIAGVRIPLDDRVLAREALAAWGPR